MTTTWVFEVERYFAVLNVDLFVEALSAEWFRSLLGVDYSCRYYKIVRGREYWRAEDNAVYDWVLEEANRQTPDLLEHSALNIQAVCDELDRATEYLPSVSWSAFSDEDLASEWISLSRKTLAVCAAINGRPVEFIQQRIYPVLEAFRQKHKCGESVDEILAVITNVDKPLAYRDEPLELLKLGVRIQENAEDRAVFNQYTAPEDILAAIFPELRQRIEDHCNRYSWLNHPYAARREPFSMLDYIRRLRHLIARPSCRQEVERIERLRAEDKERYGRIIRSAESQEKGLIVAARDFAFLRTHMAEVFDRAIVVARETLLDEARKRLSLSDPQIASMTVEEIHDSIAMRRTTVAPEELERRVDTYAYIFEDGLKRVVTGDEIDQYEEPQETEEGGALPSSVSGMTANPGVTVGPAKVLQGPQDNWKVNVGDIIIASMTTPEYIAAMEKAAAFVTDEGGITCHAAITSREFNVPCIVGTEIATQVFKDNDIVRVDTDQGIAYKV